MSVLASADRSLRLRSALAPGLAAVSVGAFVASLWFGAYGQQILKAHGAGATPLSRSIEGFFATVKLLQYEGAPAVTKGRSQIARGTGDLVVVTGSTLPATDVKNFVEGRRVLIVLPKWLGLPDPNHPGWTARLLPSPAPALNYLKVFAPAAAIVEARSESWTTLRVSGPAAQSLQTPVISNLQTFSRGAPNLVPIVATADGAPLLVQVSGSETYLLSDPDLIDNGGLKDAEGARLATLIFRRLYDGRPIVFLTTAFEDQNPLRLLFEPPLGGAALVLLAAGALALVRALSRFGPAARTGRTFAFGKRALVDSAVSLLEAARREPKIAARYADLMRAATAHGLGLSPNLGEQEVEAELDRRSASRGLPPFTRLKEGLTQAGTREAMTAKSEELYAWSQEMMHERR